MLNSKTQIFSGQSGQLNKIHNCIKRTLFEHRMLLSISKRRKNREKSLTRNLTLNELDLSHIDHKGRALIVAAFSYGGKVFWPKVNKNEVKPNEKKS